MPNPSAGRKGVPEARALPVHYRAHGLVLSSEIELPEATPAEPGRADVIIRHGAVPAGIDNAVSGGSRHRFSSEECLLSFPGVARYWLRAGHEVVVAAEPAATAEDLRIHILSSVMGMLVHRHGFFPLHASAVDVGGECLLFTGVSGAGKSTLAAACHARGHAVYTDDLSTIGIDGEGRPRVHPGYGIVKLRADALAGLGPEFGQLRAVTTRLGKQHLVLPRPPTAEPLPIRAIFALSPEASPGQEVTPLLGSDRARLLLRQTYRRRMLAGLGRQAQHFTLATRIARDVPVHLLPRPAGLDGVLRFADRLLRDFASR